MTQTELQHLFKYDHKKKGLLWKNPIWRRPDLIDQLAGTLTYADYGHTSLRVRIKGKAYQVHRLVWAYHGRPEAEFIDHIDGNPMNNRIENLRASDPRHNMQNRKSHRTGRLVGATWHKAEEKWRAQIQINKKKIVLGRFTTELEAHQRYIAALKEIGL